MWPLSWWPIGRTLTTANKKGWAAIKRSQWKCQKQWKVLNEKGCHMRWKCWVRQLMQVHLGICSPYCKTWKNGWAWHDIQSPRTYLSPCWMLLTSFTWTNSCWAQMHILMPIKHIPPENSISAWARVLKQLQILICTSISELLGIRKHWNNYIHLFLMHMSGCANNMVHHQEVVQACM